MKKLREGAINRLLNQLDRGVLSRHHFDNQFNDDSGRLISIVFSDNKDFYFKLLEPKTEQNEDSQWKTLESPGEYFTSEEEYLHRDFPAAHGRVGAWLARLVEELAVPKSSSGDWLSELRSNLDKAADSLPEPELPFTDEEAAEWSEKLKTLVDRLQTLEEENQIQKGQVAKLIRELEQLKGNSATIPKRTWLKATGHKILDVFEHGAKAGVKALAEGAVKGLLGS